MRKTLVQFLLFIIVSALIIYAYFITKANFGTLIDFKSQIELEDAKVVIKDFSLDETEGKELVWKLFSKEAKFFENTNEMFFSTMLLRLPREDKNDYLLDADAGVYKMTEKLIILKDNVKVATKDGFVFKTNILNYFTETKKLETFDKVFVNYPSKQLEITGKGLSANLEDKFFTILDEGSASSLKDKINIKSNKVNFYTKDNTIEFVENVRSRKNNINIFCNKMFVYYNKRGFQQMKAQGKVKILIDEDKKAYGNEAILDDKRLFLNGNARFVSKGDTFAGSLIEYNLKTKDVEVKNVAGTVKGLKK